jgi:hypothetical protein
VSSQASKAAVRQLLMQFALMAHTEADLVGLGVKESAQWRSGRKDSRSRIEDYLSCIGRILLDRSNLVVAREL